MTVVARLIAMAHVVAHVVRNTVVSKILRVCLKLRQFNIERIFELLWRVEEGAVRAP